MAVGPGGQQGPQVGRRPRSEPGRRDAPAEGVELLERDAGVEGRVRVVDVQLAGDVVDELTARAGRPVVPGLDGEIGGQLPGQVPERCFRNRRLQGVQDGPDDAPRVVAAVQASVYPDLGERVVAVHGHRLS